MATAPLAPGATIGILGGGQLGRMIALAAAPLGLKTHVYCPDPDSPAFDVASAHTVAPYEDEAALAAFCDAVDVVTYEFENVPAETAKIVSGRKPLFPDARALETTQDRLTEKTFLRKLGLPVPDFAPVDDRDGLAAAIAAIGRPAVLKTRRFGYDGKGQILVREGLAIDQALAAMNGQPAILEAFVPFRAECSVIAARGRTGEFRAYDVVENRHENHILRSSHVPAQIKAETAAAAVEMARKIAQSLNYVGVLGVELFLVDGPAGERVMVNEIAPRVHNSGHWTIEGAATSQFEQHVRAIAGWPLGSTRTRGEVVMTNLLGAEATRWRDLLSEPGAAVHLYGKGDPKPGRKMGHVTRVKS
ncbi:5-(carboxyamino)imidazole ribonucleotide synthase [Chelatococcus sambhunathii]|uniref:N5-carboxyaminoimidazole ribonucleotide synthase n=1 Tax=Chelatococcus sambhunathii TaxID=363953 RepID=A0ABU1DI46_9HYPH|nr:5-(carboxyamino)imidazole ribonucleotide synthase [Chelatococcus sambhunathii]MDR4307764.1 5-(carboxyamino)imidazole ribonucleotide synthase [Chelatococcus sambhunathii]